MIKVGDKYFEYDENDKLIEIEKNEFQLAMEAMEAEKEWARMKKLMPHLFKE